MIRGGVVSRAIFFFIFVVLTLPGDLWARSLYWQDMKVTATLDNDGRLHVLEQQTMAFTGAWNGGERRFNLRPGQRLDLHNIYRINPETGTRFLLCAAISPELTTGSGTTTIRYAGGPACPLIRLLSTKP